MSREFGRSPAEPLRPAQSAASTPENRAGGFGMPSGETRASGGSIDSAGRSTMNGMPRIGQPKQSFPSLWASRSSRSRSARSHRVAAPAAVGALLVIWESAAPAASGAAGTAGPAAAEATQPSGEHEAAAIAVILALIAAFFLLVIMLTVLRIVRRRMRTEQVTDRASSSQPSPWSVAGQRAVPVAEDEQPGSDRPHRGDGGPPDGGDTDDQRPHGGSGGSVSPG